MLKRNRASGIDYVTYEEYELYINTNILWVENMIKHDMQGCVELVRYCNHFVILVQDKEEADKTIHPVGGEIE